MPPLLLYESAHQDYNSSFVKLCNLLYLFTQNSPGGRTDRIDLTQENIAEILTVTRVNAARSLGRLRDEKIIVPHRRWIEIIDQKALEAYCSLETLQSPAAVAMPSGFAVPDYSIGFPDFLL